jgi:hypothetical protein
MDVKKIVFIAVIVVVVVYGMMQINSVRTQLGLGPKV